jgi:hypothetical protein
MTHTPESHERVPGSTQAPQLTYFCELAEGPLQELFADATVLAFLQATHAEVSLGILDLSDGRATVVQALNQAGVPVNAWLLLPEDEGYWFNLDNSAQAAARYHAFTTWRQTHGLHFQRVGLDIEPDKRALEAIARDRAGGLARLVRQVFNTSRLRQGERAYRALVEQIQQDGFPVESYQFPFLVDERAAGSNLLRRLTGIVDLPGANREILMLYSSFLRPWGQGMLWSYGAGAQAIGVGSTGGGVEVDPALDTRPLTWTELQTDLLLAARRTRHIYIFSLEGCARQNFFPHLRAMNWQEQPKIPTLYTGRMDAARDIARKVLWVSAHPAWLLLALAGLLAVARLILRNKKG